MKLLNIPTITYLTVGQTQFL